MATRNGELLLCCQLNLGIFAPEPINSAGCIDQSLFAGKKRMTIGADFYLNHLFGGPSSKCVSAGALYFSLVVLGVDSRFHLHHLCNSNTLDILTILLTSKGSQLVLETQDNIIHRIGTRHKAYYGGAVPESRSGKKVPDDWRAQSSQCQRADRELPPTKALFKSLGLCVLVSPSRRLRAERAQLTSKTG